MSSSPETPDFDSVFKANARYIWRSLRYLGVREADLEDVCQEVFVTAFRKLPSFEGRSSVRTWLYGICLRVASDFRRRAHVVRERPYAEPFAESPTLGSEPQGNLEARHLLTSLLSQLDDDKREVLVLYEVEGFTMKEVAEILGCPQQTAYSRLYAAREKLLTLAQERGSKAAP
ncbi:MAG TPA: RNA polymerase sigma factor [Polyangiaceae bacterium]|nr:RNA polymerase sigma factor [Polyangiaceae bacterium]